MEALDSWDTLDFPGWEVVEYDSSQGESLEEILGSIKTQRFGTILHAWGLATEEAERFECGCGETAEAPICSEYIEHWCVDFADGPEEDRWYYRYKTAHRDEGQVYRSLRSALEAKGGRQILEALGEALAAGLLLPGRRKTSSQRGQFMPHG